MSHYAVHTPLEADARFYKKYKNMGLEEPEARFASMVEGMDKSLGDLMAYLKNNDLDTYCKHFLTIKLCHVAQKRFLNFDREMVSTQLSTWQSLFSHLPLCL